MGRAIKRAQRRGLRKPLGTVKQTRRNRREVGKLTPDWLAKHGNKPATMYVENGRMFVEVITPERLAEAKARLGV